MSKLLIVIPAYNEEDSIVPVVEELTTQYPQYDYVVVNDGSSPDKDAVFAALPPEVTVLRHEKNRGKGCAMKTGMAYIWEHFSHDEGVVVVDADGQHLLPDAGGIAAPRTGASHPVADGHRCLQRL